MTDLVKYEKQVVVETFDGALFFTPESNYVAFKKALNDSKFVELNGELLNVSTIKRVYTAESGDNMTREQREEFEIRKKRFFEKLGRNPEKEEKVRMIEKIKNQTTIPS